MRRREDLRITVRLDSYSVLITPQLIEVRHTARGFSTPEDTLMGMYKVTPSTEVVLYPGVPHQLVLKTSKKDAIDIGGEHDALLTTTTFGREIAKLLQRPFRIADPQFAATYTQVSGPVLKIKPTAQQERVPPGPEWGSEACSKPFFEEKTPWNTLADEEAQEESEEDSGVFSSLLSEAHRTMDDEDLEIEIDLDLDFRPSRTSCPLPRATSSPVFEVELDSAVSGLPADYDDGPFGNAEAFRSNPEIHLMPKQPRRARLKRKMKREVTPASSNSWLARLFEI